MLTDYRRELERLGAERTLAVATSAVRDAENGEAFLGEVEWSYGFATRLLSGDEEARSPIAASPSGRTLDAETLVVDIGGGSTELITADRHDEPRRRLRADDRALRRGRRRDRRVRRSEIAPDRDVARARSASPARSPRSPRSTSAAIRPGARARPRAHAPPRSTSSSTRLAVLPLEERRRLPGLEPERAPVIVAGAAILRELLRRYGLERIEVSEHDLLHGAALAAAELPAPAEGEAPPGAYTCC